MQACEEVKHSIIERLEEHALMIRSYCEDDIDDGFGGHKTEHQVRESVRLCNILHNASKVLLLPNSMPIMKKLGEACIIVLWVTWCTIAQ